MLAREETSGVHQIGCVSFLNSKPLIEPLVGRRDVRVHFAVPSKLMGLVESGEVSTALMSVVDYQMCPRELVFVPAGMIGCDGPTLTVRIFSRVAAERIRVLHGDTDSHTSVMLAQVILRQRYGVSVEMRAWDGEKQGARSKEQEGEGGAESLLLIGDKVVNAAPSEAEYPYQMDLGEEWKKLTGLPFVFAMWMMRRDEVDVGLAGLLAEARRRGGEMTEELVGRYAGERGWPGDLARRYFTEYLRYAVTDRAKAGLEKFFELAGPAGLGILPMRRPVEYLAVG